MQDYDTLHRFLFENLAIRGEWLNLTDSWQAAKQHHQYPQNITEKLGEALAAATLLSATIKFQGNLILQVQGDGALKSLVAQSTHDRNIRGWARCDAANDEHNLSNLLGNGQMILTISPDKGEPYQGIVPVTGERITQAVENYFAQSEQLKTRLWLFANEHHAVGLLIQELPADKQEHIAENWTRIEALADTITAEELLKLPCERILHRLFHEEPVRLFPAEEVNFKCRCSHDKVASTLLSLGKETSQQLLTEQAEIIVDCEFCSAKYPFDKIDIEALFSEQTIPSTEKHSTH